MPVGSLGAMKARIALEIARTNLSGPIADAINDAIAIYQKQRFRFSETTPLSPPTFNTVATRDIYTSADNANIGTMFFIDYIDMQLSGQVYTLERADPNDLITYNQTGTSQGFPSFFAIQGNQLILSPVPDKAYPITLAGHIVVPAPPDDTTTGNPWMNDGERLIRSRAKYEIAVNVTRNADMAAAMSPDNGATYRAWRELKGEANLFLSRGQMRPTQF